MSDGKGAVLLVDDDAILLASYGRALGAVGFAVERAENGRGAVELLQRRRFDAVLSDIAMPQLDGIGLLRAVREHDLDVPVVLMTGSPSLETAERAVEYGAMRYLRKPIDRGLLVSAVEQAVRLGRLARIKREALDLVGDRELRVGDRAGLELSFNRALQGLWMAYQPIVQFSTRSVHAYEALLRSSDTTLPHPGAILGAAERLGRLAELGRLVRRQIATTVKDSEIPRCFINLHPRDLLDDDLFDVDAPLSRIAGRVVLEITERASLAEIKDLPARTGALRKLGYRIAVDDLGAGYAGLASIAQLEPEVMKIDMALVRNVDREPTKQKLVSAITNLCKQMDVGVIAEGVETAEERATVGRLGCDLLQGYLFAKPGRPFPQPTW